MSKPPKEPLYLLIQSLTKAEKRAFKLYAQRMGSPDAKFIRLFNVLDQMKEYDEEQILRKETDFKPSQLSNQKAHLYRQILTSLRLNHVSQQGDIEIRENLDYARVLFNKGLYPQSLRILEKIKGKAIEEERHTLHLQILEFEKFIESQYITRSTADRAEELTEELRLVNQRVQMNNELSNLALSLYGYYLKTGHVRDEEDYEQVRAFYEQKLPALDQSGLGATELMHLYQGKIWYYYIVQDFRHCYRYARYWVTLFDERPRLLHAYTDLYIKGLHQLALALFNMRSHKALSEVLQRMDAVASDDSIRLTENSHILLFLYKSLGQFNAFFLSGDFSKGTAFVPAFEEALDEVQTRLDPHWVILFYYKIACLYFGSGDNSGAIRYLNKIIHSSDTQVRGDIQCFARILNLIAHYELGNNDLLDYQVRSVYRFLAKMDNLQQVQVEIFRFLRNLSRIVPADVPMEFVKLKDRLMELMKDPFERRPFIYLDIISWLESKIENLSVQEVVQRKYHAGWKLINLQK